MIKYSVFVERFQDKYICGYRYRNGYRYVSMYLYTVYDNKLTFVTDYLRAKKTSYETAKKNAAKIDKHLKACGLIPGDKINV